MRKHIMLMLLFICFLIATDSVIMADGTSCDILGFRWGDSIEETREHAREMHLTFVAESVSQSSRLYTQSHIGILYGAPGILELKFHEGELYLLSIQYRETGYRNMYSIMRLRLEAMYGTPDNSTMRALDIPDANAWRTESTDIVLSMHPDIKTTLLSYADRQRLMKALPEY